MARRALQNQDALNRKEHLLLEAQRIAHIGSWEADFVTDTYSWSDELHRIYGTNPATFKPEAAAFLRIVHHDDRRAVVGWVRSTSAGASIRELEFRVVRPDGATRWVRGSVEPVLDAAGKPIGAIGTGQDITERKRSEDQLKASEDKFRTLFEAANDAIFILDMQGRFIDLNTVAYERLGYSREEMLSKKVAELDPPEFAAQVPERIELIRKYGKAVFETAHIRKDGTVMPVEINARVIDYDGRKVLYSIVRDITERKKTESQIQATSELLEAIGRAQSQVIVEASPSAVFNNLLESFLGLTLSQYGFIGEILSGEGGVPFLRTHAITNIAWNEETRAGYAEHAPHFEFTNLKTLFGAVIASGKPVLANNPAGDPRRGGLPPGHPALDSFLGLPIYHGDTLVGMVGIANRPGGYDEQFIEYCQPLLSTCGSIIAAYRNEARRKHAEAAIAKSEERYRDLFENASDAIFLLDSGQKYLDANSKAEELTGYAVAELKTMSVYDLVPPSQVARSTAEFQKLESPGSYEKFEGQLRRKDGEQIDIEVSSSAIIKDGKLVGSRDIVRDVSARKRTERQLRDSRLLYERTLASLDESVVLADLKTRLILDCNPATERIYGYSREELIGRDTRRLFMNDEQYTVFREKVLAEIAEKGYAELEFRMKRKNGDVFLAEHFLRPLLDDEGNAIGIVSVVRDISARKKAEEAIVASEERYRNLFDNANDMIQSVAPDGRFLYVNAAWRKVLGYGEDDLRSLIVFEIIHPSCKTSCEDHFAKVMAGETIDFLEAKFVAKDGRVIDVEGSANVRRVDGKTVSTQGIFRDVTERKKLQEEVFRISHDWEETFDTLTDMVTVHDKDFNIVRANKAAGQILGLPFLAANKVKCFEYFHGTGCPPAGCPSCASLVTGQPSVNEIFEPHLGRHLEIRAIPRLDSNNQVVGLIHVVRDITESTRAEEAKKERRLLAEFGMHIGTALNREGSIQEVLGACTELMVTNLGAAFARVWTMSPDEKMLVLQASSGIYTHRDGPHGSIPLDRNLKIPTIARTRKPHLTNAVIGDPQVDQEWAAREGMVAFAGYPLQVGTQLVGVMGLFSRQKLSDFTLSALEGVANNIAAGIERIMSGAALKRYSEELSALNIASNDLLALASLPEIYDMVCRFAARVFEIDLVWLGLVDAGNTEVTIAGSAGAAEGYLRTLTVTLDDSPTGGGPTALAIRSKQPRLACKDSPEYAPWRAAAEKSGFECSLAVPLISPTEAGTCIGALNFYSRSADYFTPDRVRFCQIFANQSAIAIENARLIEGLEEKVAARTREIEDANIELQHLNKELELRRTEAEAANQSKSDFLANMSHELRTPLNAIIGFSDIMLRGMAGPLAEKPKEYLGDILAGGQHLLSLINDILDLSKVEAGKMEIEPAEFDAAKLIDRSLVLFREKAVKHRLDLRPEFEGAIEPIFGDERKIRQVLYNLLSNAVKFTPDGGAIIVRARTVREAGRDYAEISVSDTGIGISSEDQKRLFQPFSQLSHHLTKDHGGSGLGLALCKSFVEMHQGRIEVKSAPGRGSTFTFIIPLRLEKGALWQS